MSVEDVDELYDRFTDSVFRLETLQVYSVPAYDERLRAFIEGRPLPPAPGKEAWVADIRAYTASGRRVHRVHVLDRPLTDYLRYELHVYRENTAAGEDVRIADRAWHPGLADLTQDFMLFDGDTDHAAAVWVRYTPEGGIHGWDATTDPADVALCRAQRDLAIAHSIALDEFTIEVLAS